MPNKVSETLLLKELHCGPKANNIKKLISYIDQHFKQTDRQKLNLKYT
jgi:hypothetical protein